MKPDVVLFDLFGTLLDIASLRAAVAEHTNSAAAVVATWREKQLGYAFASAIMDRYEDFDGVTRRALDYALQRHGVELDSAGRDKLSAAWEQVQPYPDAVPALAQLRARGVRCAVLTNGTPSTSRAAMKNGGIAEYLEATLSVDTVRVYKPDARVYALATTEFATAPDRLLFVTANGWDATGAATFGLRVAWCNRLGAPTETFGPPPDWQINDLLELGTIIA